MAYKKKKNTIHKDFLIDTYNLPNNHENIFFSSAHGIFTNTDYLSGQSKQVNKFQALQSYQIYSRPTMGSKHKINLRKISLHLYISRVFLSQII